MPSHSDKASANGQGRATPRMRGLSRLKNRGCAEAVLQLVVADAFLTSKSKGTLNGSWDVVTSVAQKALDPKPYNVVIVYDPKAWCA